MGRVCRNARDTATVDPGRPGDQLHGHAHGVADHTVVDRDDGVPIDVRPIEAVWKPIYHAPLDESEAPVDEGNESWKLLVPGESRSVDRCR